MAEPLESLIPPDIATPQPGALEQGQPGLELLAEKYLPSVLGQERDRQANIAAMQQRMAQLHQEQNSFLPTAIGIAAALRGNFGPLWQMQEQKRKTAIMTAVQPDLIKASDLVAQGKHDDAIDLITTAATSVGDRAPEFIPMFQAMQTRIAQKQQEVQTGKQVYQLAKAGQQQWEEQNPNIPYPGRHAISTLKAFVDAKQPMPQGLMNDVMIGLRQRTTMTPGGMLTEVPMVGHVVQATPQFLHTGDVTGYIADKLGSALGLSPDDITNIMNRGTIIKQGRETPVDAETQQYVRDAYTKLQATRLALQLSKDNPVTPGWVEQALRQGWTPEQIAVRAQQGPTSRQEVYQGEVQRAEDLAKAPIRAQLQEDPFIAQKNGYVPIDLTPGPTFGRDVGPVKYQDVLNNRDKVDYVREETHKNVVIPTIKAIQGLNFVSDMYNWLGRPKTFGGQFSTAVNRYVSDFIGRPVAEGIDVAKAAELFVDRSLENVEKTEKVDVRVVRHLKQYIIGRFADPEEAIRTAQYVQQRLNQELQRTIGKSLVPHDELPKAITEQPATSPTGLPPVAPSPATSQPIQVGPGAYTPSTPLKLDPGSGRRK